MRSGVSSRLWSALAIVGLVVISIFLIVLVNASPLANPTVPLENGSPNGQQQPSGILTVRLFSNQNDSYSFGNPMSRYAPLGGWPIAVTYDTNSSVPTQQEYLLTTNKAGSVVQPLPVGW